MTETLIAFAAVILLCFFGVKVGFSTLFVGMLGVGLSRGWEASLTLAGQQVFAEATNYNLSVIPLFILMGVFIHRSGISTDLFDAAHTGLRGVRAGLAHSTILACAGFAAVCGSSMATAATMTRVAMPSMMRYGYSESMATGAIAAGGTLGIMIPPSVPLVVYGLITQQDIGALFMAGIVPGVLLVLSFILVVAIWTLVSPSAAPNAREDDMPEHTHAIRAVLPVIALFVLVLGGIYGRIFTPTEAAGIGALGAALIAVSRGHLRSLAEWRSVVGEAGESTANLFVVFFGALVFTQYITLTGMPYDLVDLFTDLHIPAFGLVVGLSIIAILLGMVFEAIGILVLLVPVFLPTLEAAGVNLIWFGIVIALVIELGLITPPIGMNVFVVNNILTKVPMSKIFRGVAPFTLAMVVVLVLLLLVPQIAVFLPSLVAS